MPETNCLGIEILKLLGGKWKLPIIWIISQNKVIRYNQLKKELPGITNTSLTRALKELEDNKIINRKSYDCVPPHVEYSLSQSTKRIIPALKIIAEWGSEIIN